MKTKSVSVFGCVLGLGAIAVGVLMICGVFDCTSSKNYSGKSPYKEYAADYAFGGDFYTDIYDVTNKINNNVIEVGDTVASNQKVIIEELNDVRNVIITTSNEQNRNTGILICFIGAAFIFTALVINSVNEPQKTELSNDDLPDL